MGNTESALGFSKKAALALCLLALGLSLVVGVCPANAASGSGPLADAAFSFDTVVGMARELATQPYQPPSPIAGPLRDIDFDAWRKIRFKTDHALWRNEKLPFELQFFPPGFLYDRTVGINIVEGGKAAPLILSKAMFDFSQVAQLGEQIPDAMGTVGFRVHSAINTPSYLDEFLVFLGASYLRAVARNQNYGLSARGLAIDTALPEGEKFPWFREFWIQKPGKADKSIRIYALLDGEEATGAYAFTATPGKETVIDVQSRLFLRKPVAKLGIAPMTSMFLYGENAGALSYRDWRPEVHDSDGLLIHFRSGEWLWRPARNPQLLQVNGFEAEEAPAFGLMQRDREFADYQDLESRYETRPSLWVEPQGGWGPGRVEMVLIPSDKEIHDNLVAFWTPQAPPDPAKMLQFDYRMRWLRDNSSVQPPVMVTATRTSRPDDKSRLFVLDFEGAALKKLPEDAGVQAVVTTGPGAKVVDQQAYKNSVTGGWRVAFKVEVETGAALEKILPEKGKAIELRTFLKLPGGGVSETWSYAILPEA